MDGIMDHDVLWLRSVDHPAAVYKTLLGPAKTVFEMLSYEEERSFPLVESTAPPSRSLVEVIIR